MNVLLRVAFAIFVGVLVTAILEWLATSIPHNIDVLLGVVAAFIAYGAAPTIFPGGRPAL